MPDQTDQPVGDTERYECEQCGCDTFHVVVSDGYLEALCCSLCDQMVISEHSHLSTETAQGGGRDE